MQNPVELLALEKRACHTSLRFFRDFGVTARKKSTVNPSTVFSSLTKRCVAECPRNWGMWHSLSELFKSNMGAYSEEHDERFPPRWNITAPVKPANDGRLYLDICQGNPPSSQKKMQIICVFSVNNPIEYEVSSILLVFNILPFSAIFFCKYRIFCYFSKTSVSFP